jgi:RimJ/RimL family protein N-acetyltransferase
MRSTDLPQLTPVELTLPNGTAVSLRPLGRGDRERLAAGFERLSAESRYRRFMTPTPRLTSSELTYFSEIDHRNHFAWGVEVVKPDGLDGAGVARYVRLPAVQDAADTAFTVVDEYQGLGIGHVLLRALAIAGRVNGFRQFHFDVLADNRAMLKVLEKSGVPVESVSAGIAHSVLDLESFVAGLASWPPAGALADLARAVRPVLDVR